MSASCRELEDSHRELDNSRRKRFKVQTPEEILEQILEAGLKAAKLNGTNIKIFLPNKEYRAAIGERVAAQAVIAQQSVIAERVAIAPQAVIAPRAAITSKAIIEKQQYRTNLLLEIKNKICIIKRDDSDYMMLGCIMAIVSSPDTSPGACDALGAYDECDDEVADIFSTSNLMLKSMTPQEIRNNLTSVLYYFLNQNQNLAKLLEIAQARAKVLDEASKEDDLLNKFIELMHLLIR